MSTADTNILGRYMAAVARPAVDMVARKIQESRDRNEDLICSAEALEMMALVTELAKIGIEVLEAGTAKIQGQIVVQGTATDSEMNG